ncbi:hypothetical protein MBLNU457_g2460t1 [Dothideomycetes sp. NU457]
MSALRTPRALSQRLRPLVQQRAFSVMRPLLSSWSPSPAPPRLPKEDQEIFERLQQQSTGAFSQPRTSDSATGPAPSTGNAQAAGMRPQVNQSPASSTEQTLNARVNANGEGEELHPNVRRGAAPEFEGEVNPKTGEVGGPKVEPLRWGSTANSGDWSYNGRVTDF